jgi:nitrogen regulatory protein PII
MKRIEIYIQPYSLDAVAAALAVEGVHGMTVTECKGFGVQRGFTRGEEVKPGQYVFHPKMKVEMIVLEAEVDAIVDRIHQSLKSGQIGEGKIFVSPVDDAIRTRTGARGHDAIK